MKSSCKLLGDWTNHANFKCKVLCKQSSCRAHKQCNYVHNNNMLEQI